jgi:hypothetical protein
MVDSTNQITLCRKLEALHFLSAGEPIKQNNAKVKVSQAGECLKLCLESLRSPSKILKKKINYRLELGDTDGRGSHEKRSMYGAKFDSGGDGQVQCDRC